tara:strand:+ start:2420 stop:2626 length:207 start_codon:yes stop_codon:yes gene_type:complete
VVRGLPCIHHEKVFTNLRDSIIMMTLNYTEILLPQFEVEEISLSLIKGELITEFAGYNTLLECFLNNL